jgi:hypothetical protein
MFFLMREEIEWERKRRKEGRKARKEELRKRLSGKEGERQRKRECDSYSDESVSLQ